MNARYGRTFFLATTLLRPTQRPAVHALYAFARWADEIVDAAGVDLLQWRRLHRRANVRVQSVLDDLVAHSYAIYQLAEPRIAMLAESSRARVRTAYTLYRDILERIAVAAPGAGRALLARALTR